MKELTISELSLFINSFLLVFPIITYIIGLTIIIILFIFSALISGSEIAFFSLNNKILEESKLSDNSSKQINKIIKKPKLLLATILIANNFVNVSIIVISTFISHKAFNFSNAPILGFLIEVIVISILILLFGEILPKVYATKFPIKFALFMSKPIDVLISVFRVFSLLLIKSTSIIDKKIKRKSYNVSIDELSHALDITSKDNTIPEKDREILKGIVKFSDIDVKEIMKARIDVISIDVKTKFKDMLPKIIESGYSRIPVYDNTFDNVVGILYIKDLLPFLYENNDFEWQSLLKPSFFVPESKKINDLLKEFQEKKIHLAIIVDEYGGTSGIVTLEDIIEEIIGEINDEFDDDELAFSRMGKNSYIFEAKTSLNDFYKITGVEDDTFDDLKGDSETLAGLILEVFGYIPRKNESITIKNLVFKIESSDSRKINRIRIIIKNEDK